MRLTFSSQVTKASTETPAQTTAKVRVQREQPSTSHAHVTNGHPRTPTGHAEAQVLTQAHINRMLQEFFEGRQAERVAKQADQAKRLEQ